MFVFRGDHCVWSHYDEATSDHADLQLVLGIAADPEKLRAE